MIKTSTGFSKKVISLIFVWQAVAAIRCLGGEAPANPPGDVSVPPVDHVSVTSVAPFAKKGEVIQARVHELRAQGQTLRCVEMEKPHIVLVEGRSDYHFWNGKRLIGLTIRGGASMAVCCFNLDVEAREKDGLLAEVEGRLPDLSVTKMIDPKSYLEGGDVGGWPFGTIMRQSPIVIGQNLRGVWGDHAFVDEISRSAVIVRENVVRTIAVESLPDGWRIEVTGKNGNVGVLEMDESLEVIRKGWLVGELVFEWEKHKSRAKNPIWAPEGKVIPFVEPFGYPAKKPEPLSAERVASDAIEKGEIAEVARLLESGEIAPDERLSDWSNSTPTILAARMGQVEILELLHERGADIELRNQTGLSALEWAARAGKLESMRWLLEHDAKVDVRAGKGRTALHRAAETSLSGWAKPLEMIALLLEYGADANVRDSLGRTPLMFAADRGLEESMQLLVESGADPALRDKYGKTAADLLVEQEARKRARKLKKKKP